MEQVILQGKQGDQIIKVSLRLSARAKRLSLRVSRLDGRVTLTMPKQAHLRDAEGFVRDRENWIRKNLDATPAPLIPRPGGTVLYAGTAHNLTPTGGRAARLGNGEILLPLLAPEKTGPRLAALFKHHARLRLHAASDHYAGMLGQTYSSISLRDTRSRWGSCSTEGRLMYSWRLIMAPPEVLDYVAAHEVAHLAQMNHSPAFWAHVAKLMPDYQTPRIWLRKNGALLHAVKFRD